MLDLVLTRWKIAEDNFCSWGRDSCAPRVSVIMGLQMGLGVAAPSAEISVEEFQTSGRGNGSSEDSNSNA